MQRGGTGDGSARAAVDWRRARMAAAREVATPLTATFLGLLLVQSLQPAFADEVAPAGGGGGGDDGLGTAETAGSPAAEAGRAAGFAGAPAIAPGSILAMGGLIDPAALTRLSGDARFAEPATAPVSTTTAAGEEPGVPMTPAAVELSGGVPSVEVALPSLAATDAAAGGDGLATGDEDLENLGEYQRGTDEDRTVVLTPKDDVYLGGKGDEHVIGGAGDDQLSGGGDDVLEGGADEDRLAGGSGDDRLEGGTGDDQLAGGSGDDKLTGGEGDDRLGGDTGSDVLVLDDPTDTVKEMGLGRDLGGVDTLLVTGSYAEGLAQALPGLSPDGRATFVMGTPDVATFPQGLAGYRQQVDPDIENLRLEGTARHDVVGGAGDNVIEGNFAANHLFGGGGHDRILGDAGDDWLHGDAGNDWLEGGDGADLLYGGGGNDVFVLGLHEATDQIFDHEGSNRLHLSTGEPERVGAELRGSDLAITFDGLTLAILRDYAGHETAFAGIDLGDGVRSFDSLQADPGASRFAAGDDWLAGFMSSEAEAAPLDDPWSAVGIDASPAGTAGSEPLAAPASASRSSTADPFASASAYVPVAFAVPDLAGGGDLWLPADPHGDPSLALPAEIGREDERSLAG